jgi:hypothetical protein
MLHIVHLIERRRGHRVPRFVPVLVLASAAALAMGIVLAMR